ncbi:2TM domain-containing protein [Tenacibaculum sp. TC6]|uniref:2TM domain-containing protein n=1 Tax=Tenacibaculum sp. TC6 TaxID=3423223 RepID=UPI003D367F33
METENFNQEQKYLRAKKRVDEIKRYYIHLAVYIAVNLFISIKKIVRNMNGGETFEEALLDFNTFSLWIFWGIGIVFHTFRVFGFDFFMGKNWEERKIKEFMEK